MHLSQFRSAASNNKEMLVKCIIIFIIQSIQYKDLFNGHGIMRCYNVIIYNI